MRLRTSVVYRLQALSHPQWIILAILIFGAACSGSGESESSRAAVNPGHGARCASEEMTDISEEPNYSADYLHRWHTADGCEVRLDILMMRQGDDSCGGPDVADIFMTWPLGSTDTEPGDEHRIFMKDPTGVFNERTTELYQEDATLPEGARDTGFRLEETELWMVPEDDSFIYLVDDDNAERWPLDESPEGCV